MAEQTYHRPVLLDQTIEALAIRPDGIYLDGTAGGGGHSHAIASRLTPGRLISLDQDPDAIAAAVGAGATSVSVCDDAGCLLPDDFAAFVGEIVASASVSSVMFVFLPFA